MRFFYKTWKQPPHASLKPGHHIVALAGRSFRSAVAAREDDRGHTQETQFCADQSEVYETGMKPV